MLRRTVTVLRRGRPNPPAVFLREWERGLPETHRPFQGGQPHFHDFLLRTVNDEAANTGGKFEREAASEADIGTKLPFSDFAANSKPVESQLEDEMAQLRALDGFQTKRSYNELDWYDVQSQDKTSRAVSKGAPEGKTGGGVEEQQQQGAASGSTGEGGESTPQAQGDDDDLEHIMGNDDFESQFGYSMVKKSSLPVTTNYSQIDMWGEAPKYSKGTYFLYLVSRRRNFYAVMYDMQGKRIHPVFTAGNRGMKGGNKGLSGEGSADTAHQVTSQYLNELIPKIRELDAKQGLKRSKIDIVVRVLGFYNGRGGGMRAVQDRGDVFNVRYLEDVTPFPLNGPKMPTKVRRNASKV